MAVWDHAIHMQTSLSPPIWPAGDSLAESAPWACSLAVGMVPGGDRDGLGHPLVPGDAMGSSHPLHLGSRSPVYFWEPNSLALGTTSDKRCNVRFWKQACHWINGNHLLKLHPIISHWKTDMGKRDLITLTCFKHKGKNNTFEISMS